MQGINFSMIATFAKKGNHMKILLLLIIFASIGGCTTTSPYRSHIGILCEYKTSGDCHDQAMSIGNSGNFNEYILSFLEFDEQGMIHHPQARKIIMSKYREIATDNEVLLITYFHGWHHNAKGKDDEDSDIVQFRKVLSKAAETHTTKKVLGIYIGWRGRSLAGFLNYFTFWGRKYTAHEIGQNGGITDVLLELEKLVEESNNSNSKMVTIGHSFGGAALYSTLNLVLADRYSISHTTNPNDVIEGFGDLVVLLNPAFEATRYSSLFQLAQNNCSEYSTKQLPKLVILSSEADLPVSMLFQAGQFMNAIFEEHRNTVIDHCVDGLKKEHPLRQFRADINGIGHFPPYLTHDLSAQNIEKSFSSQDGKANLAKEWRDNLKSGRIMFNKTILKSRNITMPFNPYMNIYTDEKVMSGHNDIWTDEVLDFLNEIIRVSTL
jgi:hypothetical protein